MTLNTLNVCYRSIIIIIIIIIIIQLTHCSLQGLLCDLD